MDCPACDTPNIEGARFCAKCGTLVPTREEPEVDPLIGQELGGRYTIVKLLGEGGMGRVYEAERSIAGLRQRVAVKTLHSHLSRDPGIVERFHRECRTVAQLKHPNTIRVEDFGQAGDGTLYIAMEFVEGPNCAKVLEDHGPMAPERVERILGQVCGSLSEAHKQGIVHRDLKPENIVLTTVGDEVDVVKVLDFGIAARKGSTDAAKEQKLTQQGMVLGTPPYMSPEQFSGKELDARSDIYSLGVMAYEMLSGRLPFEANTPWEWATKHLTAQPFPFEDSPTFTDVPGKMKAAITRAMLKKPEERHATVREFFEDFSIGAGRMLGATTTSDVHSGAVGAAGAGGTAVLTPHQPSGPVTQSAEPMAQPATPMPMPSPMMQPAMMPPQEAAAPSGGGGGKLIWVLVGVVALGVAGTVAALMFTGKKDSGGDESSGAAASAASSAPPPDAKPVVTAVAHPTATTPPRPTVTGEEACQEALKRAGSDVVSAYALYGSCSGSSRENARRAIAGAIPTQVGQAANSGKCARARQIAGIAGGVGAAAPNVDAQYARQCKGK
ncbi:MAG: protein kinase [Polyangiaceae bacterium]|nr:protein kinase [Polyangiaceae bacterium]